MRNFFIVLVLLAPLPVVAQVATGPKWAPSNFDTTVNGNFRGARITSKAQLDSMKRIYGITTIINLAKDALPKKGESEIQWSKELGMEYVHVYLGTKPPSSKDWELIKSKLAQGKAYIHCAHGADRTGAIVAKYRLETNQCNPEQAYREARKYGFKPWLKDFRSWIQFPEKSENRSGAQGTK